ncbi:MAG: hypothetical protein O6913_06925 [Chloroflexi bacterium]|nr:hypothetical protein [Chloroflexota bacterium]
MAATNDDAARHAPLPVDGELESRLRAFANEAVPATTAAVWARVAQELPQRPQRRVLLRRVPTRPTWNQPARRITAMAAGVAIAAVISLSVLLTGGSTADASFLAAVNGLSTATDAALADGSISQAEAQGLAERVDLVQAAIAADETLPTLAPAQVAAALAALADVEQRLVEHARPGLSQAIQTLGRVRGQVQGIRPAAGAGDDAPGRPESPGDPRAEEGDGTPPGRPQNPGGDDAGSRRPGS